MAHTVQQMSIEATLPWLFAGILILVHYFGDRLDSTAFAHREKVTSFSAGVTVSYVFLQLLPEHHSGAVYLGDFGPISVLIGFSAVHVTEKWVYHHEKTAAQIREDFRELHSIFLFLYYFVIGLLLYELVQSSITEGMLFFIPVLFHTAVSSFSLLELDEELLSNRFIHGAITVSAVIGTATGYVFHVTPPVFYALLGVVTGMFLYLVIHDSLPDDDAGRPEYFVVGLLCYTAVLIATWLVL